MEKQPNDPHTGKQGVPRSSAIHVLYWIFALPALALVAFGLIGAESDYLFRTAAIEIASLLTVASGLCLWKSARAGRRPKMAVAVFGLLLVPAWLAMVGLISWLHLCENARLLP